MKSALKIRNLNKAYKEFSLKDVSFEVPEGYIMGFIGPNGAGKTTTIKCALGMVGSYSGKIELLGNSIDNSQLNAQVGIVMDTPFYVEDWKIRDVEKAFSPIYAEWDSEKFAYLLKKFRLEKTKKVKELSRGMKVKLMLAVALSHNPKLLVLDEPTSGLDPVARDELCEILGEFVTDEKRSVLFSTHITADLEKIADYITFILDGKIAFTGKKEDLLEKYVSVKGGLADLNSENRELIIGLREHSSGFEGMVRVDDIRKLPRDLLFEPISLDEIIINMNREVKPHE